MAAPSGTVWGSIVKGSENTDGRQGRIGIYVKVTSTDTQTTVNVQGWFWSKYSVSDGNNKIYYDIGTSVSSATTNRGSISISHTVASGAGWSTSNQTKLFDVTNTYSRGTSAVTYKVYAKFNNIDILPGSMLANTSFTVPALASYTVAYNANGGGGAPASQKKTHGVNLTLSTVKPTRTGYSFQGWALTKAEADDGDWYYGAGYTCGKNENLTLYAVWQVNTYSVQYNANGGTGAPSKQTKTYGVTLELSKDIPTRTNYKFLGWGTSASATTVTYKAGAKYSANAAVMLYAVWELAYVKPRITNVSISRCDASGAETDTGTCARVKFDYACDQDIDGTVIGWKSVSGGHDEFRDFHDQTKNSDSIDVVLGANVENAFTTDSTYAFTITVTDVVDESTVSATLRGTLFAVDFISGGDGVAFGKPAELHNYADFNFTTRFRKNQLLENNIVVYGKSTEDENLALLYINSQDYINLGYGGYRNSVGATYLYGNEVRLMSRGSVFANGYRLAENKVLWSSTSGYYMMTGQTATLNEAISDQANGVVLVWSFYEDGAAKDGQFNTFFIPKHFIAAHEGKGISSFLTTASVAYVATKYLYVSDTSIIGYDGNNAEASTTSSGIKVTRLFLDM